MTSDGYEKRPSVRSLTEASSDGDFHAIIDGSHPSPIMLIILYLLSSTAIVIDGIFECLIISLITVTKVRLFFEICKKKHNYFSMFLNYFCKEYSKADFYDDKRDLYAEKAEKRCSVAALQQKISYKNTQKTLYIYI